MAAMWSARSVISERRAVKRPVESAESDVKDIRLYTLGSCRCLWQKLLYWLVVITAGLRFLSVSTNVRFGSFFRAYIRSCSSDFKLDGAMCKGDGA